MSFRARTFAVAVGCLGLASIVSSSAQLAPNVAATNPAKPMAYDTVSVRENKSGTLSSGFHPSADGLTLTNFPLPSLMVTAFRVRSTKYISGLPGWTQTARFDFVAKLDDDSVAALQKLPPAEAMDDRRVMMQQILIDRFALKLHHEKKDFPAYALVVAKGGSKLKEVDPNILKNPTANNHPGSVKGGDGEFSGPVTTGSLAGFLSGVVDREVVDQTGLTGKYDIQLTWLSKRAAAQEQDEHADPAQASQASILTALQEQLGLRLESIHDVPVDTLVVDHIEMPSDN